MSYAGVSALGNGYFALYLRSILLTGNVSYEYKGEEEVGGRRLARFDYRLPVMWSGQIIQTPEGSGNVGLHGSYWADPQTYDVIRLEMNADDFPPTLPVTEMVTSINYSRTRLGDHLVALLPESAEFRMAKFSGEISRSRMEFTHCHVFGAQSTINFGPPDSGGETPQFGVASIDDTLRSLPSGLQVAVKTGSRISADMAVGTSIDGEVAANVPAKGAVVIAAGSPIRGRIRRLERYTEPLAHFVLALEFTEVESHGIRYRFYADLVEIEPASGVEQTLSSPIKEVVKSMYGGWEFKRTGETLWLPNLPGVAAFFVKGSNLNLPQGFRTVWKTRPFAP
jgi:hypothetical protein